MTVKLKTSKTCRCESERELYFTVKQIHVRTAATYRHVYSSATHAQFDNINTHRSISSLVPLNHASRLTTRRRVTAPRRGDFIQTSLRSSLHTHARTRDGLAEEAMLATRVAAPTTSRAPRATNRSMRASTSANVASPRRRGARAPTRIQGVGSSRYRRPAACHARTRVMRDGVRPRVRRRRRTKAGTTVNSTPRCFETFCSRRSRARSSDGISESPRGHWRTSPRVRRVEGTGLR